MSKRKSISKGMRFDVLNRDNFTCQYCGKSAPEVKLEVDHIKPVVNGGKNKMKNLITSCEACNRGKHSKEIKALDKKTNTSKKTLDYLEAKKHLEYIERYYEDLERPVYYKIKILRYIKILGCNIVEEAIISYFCNAGGDGPNICEYILGYLGARLEVKANGQCRASE